MIKHIAVTSQNRRHITGHAGKCRKFWLYEIDGGRVCNKRLLELPPGASLHDQRHALAPALADIDVLICGGMGGNLYERLMLRGIRPVITIEQQPDDAVRALLANQLANYPPHPSAHAHHATRF
ncbi:MAG: NifB/NifX family molybdenum-iron cluster-binding protein [Azonexus sp.]|nr:NifB/NifX family molybdenum-iron cluster-binding protein [Azonexus sp.]